MAKAKLMNEIRELANRAADTLPVLDRAFEHLDREDYTYEAFRKDLAEMQKVLGKCGDLIARMGERLGELDRRLQNRKLSDLLKNKSYKKARKFLDQYQTRRTTIQARVDSLEYLFGILDKVPIEKFAEGA